MPSGRRYLGYVLVMTLCPKELGYNQLGFISIHGATIFICEFCRKVPRSSLFWTLHLKPVFGIFLLTS